MSLRNTRSTSHKLTPTSKKSNIKAKNTPEASPNKLPVPSPPKTPKTGTICQICQNDDVLRETLKQFNSSHFATNTARLKELDEQLTERITQVSNVNLRIQHLLLNENAFAE